MAIISLGMSTCCGLIIETTEPVEIAIKNELSTPIQNASVRLSKDKQKKDFFKWLTQSRHDDTDVIFIHTGGAPALFAYQSVLGI